MWKLCSLALLVISILYVSASAAQPEPSEPIIVYPDAWYDLKDQNTRELIDDEGENLPDIDRVEWRSTGQLSSETFVILRQKSDNMAYGLSLAMPDGEVANYAALILNGSLISQGQLVDGQLVPAVSGEVNVSPDFFSFTVTTEPAPVGFAVNVSDLVQGVGDDFPETFTLNDLGTYLTIPDPATLPAEQTVSESSLENAETVTERDYVFEKILACAAFGQPVELSPEILAEQITVPIYQGVVGERYFRLKISERLQREFPVNLPLRFYVRTYDRDGNPLVTYLLYYERAEGALLRLRSVHVYGEISPNIFSFGIQSPENIASEGDFVQLLDASEVDIVITTQPPDASVPAEPQPLNRDLQTCPPQDNTAVM